MFRIDQRNRTPIYEQLIENVKEYIIKGLLDSGEKLPSVRELAKMMTLNPNTVQKAYRELERQGVIVVLRGKGTFVAEDYTKKRSDEGMLKLKDLFKKAVIEAKYLSLNEDDIQKLLREVMTEIKEDISND